MRATIPRLALESALRSCLHSVDARPTLPVLADVLLRPEGRLLAVCSTDLNLSTVARVECDAVGLPVCVPAKRLHEIVKGTTGETLSLDSEDGGHLRIVSRGGRYSIPVDNAQDFPKLFTAPGAWQTVPAVLFHDMAESAGHAMNPDTGRVHEGCLIEGDGKSLTIFGTDGHRAALATRPVPVKLSAHPGYKGAMLLRRGLPRDGEIEIAADDAWLYIRFGLTEHAVKLLGDFPNLRAVLPKSWESECEVHREDAAHAVRQVVAAAARDSLNAVTEFHFGRSGLTVRAQGDKAEASERVDLTRIGGKGKPLSTAANGAFIADALEGLTSERVRFRLGSMLDPILIVPAGDSADLCCVMPCRRWDKNGYHGPEE